MSPAEAATAATDGRVAWIVFTPQGKPSHASCAGSREDALRLQFGPEFAVYGKARWSVWQREIDAGWSCRSVPLDAAIAPSTGAGVPAGPAQAALCAITAYREARRDFGRTSDEASAAYARLLEVEERLRGSAYTDEDLEQEARRVHQECYPGQFWGSDSSARVVSYKEARRRLAASPEPAAPAPREAGVPDGGGVEQRPVAWRVRDYAGYSLYASEAAALNEAAIRGEWIAPEPLYAAPRDGAPDGGGVDALLTEARRERESMFMAPSGGNAGDTTLHARNWADKPSRVLYDACKLIDRLCDAIASSARQNARSAPRDGGTVPAARLDWHAPTDDDKLRMAVFGHGGLITWAEGAWHSLMLAEGEVRIRPLQWAPTEVADVPGMEEARDRTRLAAERGEAK